MPPLTRDDSVLYFPPEAFGPFRVLHQIGAGALGPVFRAHEPDRGRLVAIKVFQLTIIPEHVAALVQALDALVARGLGHPGIAAPIAAGIDGNAGNDGSVAYLAQEYAIGESLDVVMRERGSMPLAMAAPLIDRLAAAIDFAARRGVHHGLLHPRDVILGEDGPRITGFGVAEALAGIGAALPVRRPYAAPELEQSARGPRELPKGSAAAAAPASASEWGPTSTDKSRTSSADVFALAAIAWELISGRRLVGTGADAVRSIGQLKTESGGDLGGLFAAALSDDPAARPSRARIFAVSLRKAAGLEAPDLGEVETVRLKPDTTDVVPDTTYVGSVLPPSREASAFAEAPADRRSLGGGWSADRPLLDEAVDAGASSPAERPLEMGTPERFAEVGAASDLAIDFDPGPAVETVRLKPDATDLAPDATDGCPVLPPSRDASAFAEAPADRRSLDGGWSADRHSLGGGGSDRPAFDGAEDSPRPRRIGILAVVGVLAAGILVGFLAGYGLRSAEPAKAEAPERGLTPELSRGADPINAAALPATTEVVLPPVAAPPAAVAPIPAPAPAPKSAPPPSPPPVRSGGLQVRTTPAGASVIVNGKPRGRTPLTLRELPLGSYTIRLTRDGYMDEERRLQLTTARATSTVAVTLTRAAEKGSDPFSGSLLVESRPPGAQVFLNGRLIGKTPLSMPDLPVGPATVRIERDGYQPWVSTVDVVSGQRTRVAASLDTKR